MSKLADHPTREELSAYSLGQLPEERAVAIDSHISECEPCCETIVELSSEDTFAGLLQEAGRLPTDQTADHDSVQSKSSSNPDDIPQPLSEHPRYEILGLIGKGGMGDVYKARHRKMERTVALKVINRGLVQKAEAIDRFHREVKAAAQLSHPNIVTSHDADHAGGFHFMVMEFVDGIDLSQTVKKRGALPVAEACDYIRQAAMGLQHAHERGMVHRDIKPHNMMVTADGTVKILDFGLASLAPEALVEASSVEARGELTAAGAIMGTPDFISPEQADDARKADIRSDIYSLGATLYYLLSGRVPFDDGSVMHKLKSHAQVEPAPLSSVRDDVPEKLVAIASKMMAKDPDERYLTPKEVAEALESFLRTWQPDEENTPRQGASNGGNDSGSDGKKPMSDDSNPSRLPMVAKFLLYTSLLPIGLTFVNEFVPLPLFSGETDWFWYCVLTSIALSTIGGIMLGVHQGISSIRDGQRNNGITTGQTALIIFILAVSAFGILRHMSDGKWHLEVTPQSDRMTLGTHPLTIVNTSGEKPFGGTHRTHNDKAAGITTRSFESANGRYKITLVDKVLTVNGKKYTLENPTDAIRIVDDRVEITQVTSLPDGERFNSKALPDDVKVQQILDRMAKVYAECKSYRDYGVIKSVFHKKTASPEFTVEHSFTTAFERPDRFRFEIKDQYDDELLISLDGEDVQTSWDIEPGFPKPESLELAMAQAVGFTGGDVGRIPAMLMPKQLDGWVDLNLIDPIQIEDGKLQNVECFRLQYNFRDEQITLWIDKQSHLVRRIDEWLKSDDVRIERTTTCDPTIDGKITDEMLEFAPPAPQASDDGANTLPGSALGGNDSPPPPAQERDADAATQKAGQQRSDNQFDMPLCWCPAGEFKMGRKQLPVTLTRGFWMGKYEVTQAQYEALMGENLSENKGESLPVEKVEWTKATKFCQKFTELERKAGRLPKGWEYRLPTEAQWEYACRAGTTLIWDEKDLVYPSTFGDDLSELGDYAWYSENCDGTPHPGGQKKPNAWGLCDMHGNVSEWVRDAWQSKLTGGKDPEVDVSFPIRTLRGGDWLSYAESCGSPFNRGFVVGGREVPHMTGFRVALVSVGDSSDSAATDHTQLQGDWESVSVTESGKQLSNEDGFGRALLQLKDNTFVIMQRKPDGAKNDVDAGQIEINSSATPKTIDFIGRAERRFGIYEFKQGMLRVCLVEQAGPEGPRGERFPDGNPVKRPTTFESPTGSNMMLMEFQRKQPDANTEQQTRNLLDTTYISNDTVGLLVAYPQRILSAKSKVQEELDQMFAKVAESERLDVRNLRQIVVQLGPPPLSSSPIKNLFDEQLWTVILRFDEPLDVDAYIDKYAQGYKKAKHKHSTYYKHDSRMEMWFPDNRTLILAAERRILNLIDDPQGKGPMALRMRRADAMADLLLEIDVRQGGPLLLESLPSEMLDPELRPLVEQALQKIKHITLSAKQNSDTPIQARFHAVDAEKANELLAQAVVWLEAAKTGWPKLRDLIRERPADKDTTPPNRRALALAFANEIDSVLPALRSTVDEDQLLVRLEQQGGVNLATLLAFFLLID